MYYFPMHLILHFRKLQKRKLKTDNSLRFIYLSEYGQGERVKEFHYKDSSVSECLLKVICKD